MSVHTYFDEDGNEVRPVKLRRDDDAPILLDNHNLNMSAPTYSDYRRIAKAAYRLSKRGRLASAYENMGGAELQAELAAYNSNRKNVFGRGAYSLGKAWRATVGKQGGRMLRQALLNKAVDTISGSGAYTGGMYTGRGAYNNLMVDGSEPTNSVPLFDGAGDETGGIMIAHTEYISDVYAPGVAGSGATTPFYNQSFPLNPGLGNVFPWLSQIAANYEEYEFIQLYFTWKSAISPTVGNNANGQVGTVVLTTNYNPAAKAFTEKASMLGYAHGFDAVCYKDFTHFVECDPDKIAGDQTKYVRTSPVPPGEDIKTYDHGTFQFAMCNFNPALNASAVGELWVTYKVRLNKPRLYVSLAQNLQRDDYCSATSAAKGLIGSNAAQFPANQPVYSNITNNLGTMLTLGGSSGASGGAGSSMIITFPAGFVGAVRVVILNVYTTYVAGTLRPAGVSSAGLTGNVTPIYDMFTQDGTPAWSVTSNPGGTGCQVAGGDASCEFHLYVRPATGAVNNSCRVDCLGTDTGACLTSWQVIIAEYNSAGVTLLTDRATYTNGALSYVAGAF